MGLLRLALNIVLGPPVVLLALISAAAGVAALQGRHSLRWDLLTHFAPVWLAGALLAGLFALLLFGGMMRLLVLALTGVGVVAGGALMAPELTRSAGPRAGPDAPGQLKIIQFNVWNHNSEIARTIDWMAAERPDLVILEETTPAFRRALEARTGWRSVCRDCEVMIYSPRQMTRGYVSAEPAVGPLAHAIFHDVEGAFDVVGVHDAWPTDGNDQQRQEARLARALDELPRERTILAGDFNSTPWSFARRDWDSAFRLIRRDRALFTWPAGKVLARRMSLPFAILPIDHVYAGPAWATVDIHRGPSLGSDHYPLVATLAPVEPPPATLDDATARPGSGR